MAGQPNLALSAMEYRDVIERVAVLPNYDLYRLMDLAVYSDFPPEAFYLDDFVEVALNPTIESPDDIYDAGNAHRGMQEVLAVIREFPSRVCGEGEGNFDWCKLSKEIQDIRTFLSQLASFGILFLPNPIDIPAKAVLAGGVLSVLIMKTCGDALCECPDTMGRRLRRTGRTIGQRFTSFVRRKRAQRRQSR